MVTAGRTANGDTKERLLAAAERLFGEEGFARTSLRAITLAAGVNVAAVHYHFGSKEALLAALFTRRAAPLNADRLARLDAIEAAAGDGALPLEAVLEAFVAPAFRLIAELDPAGPSPAQLIARFFSEPEEVVQRMLREQFGEVGARFLVALRRALPEVAAVEVGWRFEFMIAVLTHLLSRMHLLEIVPGRALGPADEATTIRRAVTFLAAGFRAPAGGAA